MIVDNQETTESQTLQNQDGTICKAKFKDLPENDDNVLFQPSMQPAGSAIVDTANTSGT